MLLPPRPANARWQRSPSGRWAERLPIVDGTINGQKIGIMIDTGASRAIVFRAAADRLGLVRHDARGRRMIGVGGESNVQSVLIDELAIGAEVRRNWRALVAGEHEFGTDTALILGEDFFRLADVEFDLAHNAIRLFQARDCETGRLPTGRRKARGRRIRRDHAGLQGSNHCRDQRSADHGIARPGASSTVVTKSQAAALGVTPESAGVIAGGCSSDLARRWWNSGSAR
jgi:clan AA aspartic protease (TIGR02281 family)